MSPNEGQEEPLRRLAKLVNSFMSHPDATPFLEPVDWRGLELFDYPKIVTRMMDLGTIKRKIERKQYNTAWECASDIKLVWSNCMSYNAEGSELWVIAKAFNRKFEDKFRKIKQEFDVGDYLEEEDDEEDDEEEDEEDKDSEEDEEGDGHDFVEDVDMSGGEGKGRKSGGGPSLDAKAQLASNLILLVGTELGQVMKILEQECPQALESLPVVEPEETSNQVDYGKGTNTTTSIPEKVEIILDNLDSAVFNKISQFAAERATGRQGGISDDVSLEDVSGKRKRKR